MDKHVATEGFPLDEPKLVLRVFMKHPSQATGIMLLCGFVGVKELLARPWC